MGTGLYIFRFKWERNNAISLVTVKMGLVIPISHGNLPILPIAAQNTAVFYPGNFTEKRPAKFYFTVYEGKEWLNPSREKN